MKLIDSSIREAHAVIVVTLLCGLFGYLAMKAIPVQLKPSVDNPEVQIITNYRGAAPSEVEEQITTPIEEQMESVEGVNKITSTSSEGTSTITLEFDWGVDKGAALVDVINKLNQIPDLPEEAEEPVVLSVTTEQQEAIMWIVSHSDTYSTDQLFDLINESVEPRMRRIHGVSDLMIFGGEEREMQVLVSAEKMAARGVSIGELISSLRRENLNVRGGFLDQGKRRFNLRTVGQFEEPGDVLQVIVARNASGAVYLHEVAEVQPGFKKRLSQVRNSGDPTVVMGIRRKSGANVVQICKDMAALIASLNTEFKQKSQDIDLTVAYTDLTYIEQAIDLAWNNLLEGAILAALVLIIFLRSWRSVLVIAISIPTCMITVFIFVKGLDRSLNIISLAGLAFSSGMIVDNAIVVIENIYRHISLGKRPMAAALDGTNEVFGAVVSSTLTTLVVFIPVIFIQEEAGQLFKDIAITICLSITLSMVAAFTLIPMMAGRLISPGAAPSEGSVGAIRRIWDRTTYLIGLVWVGQAVHWAYSKFTDLSIGRSWGKIVFKVVLLVVVVAFFLLTLKLLPSREYLPSGNRNFILVFAKPLVGNSIEKSASSIEPFEAQLKQDQRVERFFSVFGLRFNAVGIIVKPEHASEMAMKGLVGEMFGRTRMIHGFESLFPIQVSIFRDPGKELKVDIIGPDLNRLASVAQRLQGQLFGTPGVQFVRSDYQAGNPEIQVRLDRERAAALGLRTSEVADLVESLVAGKQVGTFSENGRQLDLSIYANRHEAQSLEALRDVPVIAPDGSLVKLNTVASVDMGTGPTTINHVEKQRSITLSVNLTDAVTLEEAISTIEANILAPARATLPVSYTLRMSGTADKLKTTLDALTSSFVLAVVIVYLLMVSLFRSWLYPMIIMVTIPLAASGAFLGITLAHKWSGGLIIFDVLTMLGLIILAGIVVNNAILIVHQALNFREQGMTPDDALKESCKSRLRPIFMSVITTVLGMLPLALGQGAGTELYRGLGVVIIAGLLVSTIFTLFAVPALMSLLQDVQAWIRRDD